MPSHHTISHQKHVIMSSGRPAPGSRFYSEFSIHRLNEDEPKKMAIVHQESGRDTETFATENDAIDDGHRRAKAWIDAQLK